MCGHDIAHKDYVCVVSYSSDNITKQLFGYYLRLVIVHNHSVVKASVLRLN